MTNSHVENRRRIASIVFPLQFFYTSRTVLKKAIDEYRNPGTWPALKSMFGIQTVMRATHANAESFKPGHPP